MKLWLRRWWFQRKRWLQGRDYCERCSGVFGTRGNENRHYLGDGTYLVECDFCSAKDLLRTILKTQQEAVEKVQAESQVSAPQIGGVDAPTQ